MCAPFPVQVSQVLPVPNFYSFKRFPVYIFRPVCQTPETDFYYAPTTVRRHPFCYTSCQSSISRLIAAQVQDQQTRALPLPGYLIDPANLNTDGVHFLSITGQDYCRHLIDSARYTYHISTLCYLLPMLTTSISLYPFCKYNCTFFIFF